MKQYSYNLLLKDQDSSSYIIPNRSRKLEIFLVIGIIYIIAYCFYAFGRSDTDTITITTQLDTIQLEIDPRNNVFLLETEGCKIKRFNPFDPEIMATTQIKTYEPCVNVEELTTIHFNSTSEIYTLRIKKDFIRFNISLSCSYEAIVRKSEGKIEYEPAVIFTDEIVIPEPIENIFVSCKVDNKEVYKNVYAIIRNKRRSNPNQVHEDPISVILFGIDSISSNSLIRNMPETWSYLQSKEYWFNLPAYNRVSLISRSF